LPSSINIHISTICFTPLQLFIRQTLVLAIGFSCLFLNSVDQDIQSFLVPAHLEKYRNMVVANLLLLLIMRPFSLGGGRIMRRTLSVCLSVCLSVRLSVCLSVRPVIVASRRAT